MRKIILAGIGPGSPELMTQQVVDAAKTAQYVIGARRMLDSLPHNGQEFESILSDDIARIISQLPEDASVLVAFSGDLGFYSGAKKLLPLLPKEDQVTLMPGISSLQILCARLETTWSDAHLVSVHGRTTNVLGHVLTHKKTFFLTGSTFPIHEICRILTEAGLGDLKAAAGENLSYPNERITKGTAQELSTMGFDSLGVLMVENPTPYTVPRAIGDEEFIRGKTPMTKQSVRIVSVAKLGLTQDSILWDVGAGTGSVSIEGAQYCPMGHVYSIEKEADAIALLRENQKKFGVYHMTIVEGKAPQALETLPVPDAVFVGGSSGNMAAIISTALSKNPKARFVINAITLETVSESLKAAETLNLQNLEVLQLSAAQSKQAGRYHMMMGQNPVFILSAQGGEA